MTSPTLPQPALPDLTIPFLQALADTAAKPPFDSPGAPPAAAAGAVIRGLVTQALAHSKLAGTERQQAISATETAIGFACWGAVRYTAELSEAGVPSPDVTQLMLPYLDVVSGQFTEAEVTGMVEMGMKIFDALRSAPQLEGLCNAIQDLFSWYARTGDASYVELASAALIGLSDARKRATTGAAGG